MRDKTTTLSEPFPSLKEAEEYLQEHGWRRGHAGAWVHPQRPGVVRSVRRPSVRVFKIAETAPLTSENK